MSLCWFPIYLKIVLAYYLSAMYFVYKRVNVLKAKQDSSELFFTLILKYKYHHASSISSFLKRSHKHMLIISVCIKSHAQTHTRTHLHRCTVEMDATSINHPDLLLSFPLSLIHYALIQHRMCACRHMTSHRCHACVCLRVILSSSINAGPVSVGGLISLETSERSLFFGRELVPAPVDGGAETCCALGFLVHIASNSANSKQEMKDEVWMRQDKRWEATLGLMRVARLRALRVTVAAWGASVLYRCWTPLCGC